MVPRKSWVSDNFSPISESWQIVPTKVLEFFFFFFFLFGSEIASVSGSDFQTRLLVSRRVSDFTIHHP